LLHLPQSKICVHYQHKMLPTAARNHYKTNVVYKFNVSDLEKCFSLVHWYIHGPRDREVKSTFAAKLGFISVDT